MYTAKRYKNSNNLKYRFLAGYVIFSILAISLINQTRDVLAITENYTPIVKSARLLILTETTNPDLDYAKYDNEKNEILFLQNSSIIQPNCIESDCKKTNDSDSQKESVIKIEIQKPVFVSTAKFINNTVIETGKVMVTAYSSTPDQTDSSPFITASGTYVHDGTLACNFLKFGTKVKFPSMYGDKIFIVEDRMARHNSYKMDIWMPTRVSALQFGVRTLTYQVVET